MQQIQDGRGLRYMAEAVAGDGCDEVKHFTNCARLIRNILFLQHGFSILQEPEYQAALLLGLPD